MGQLGAWIHQPLALHSARTLSQHYRPCGMRTGAQIEREQHAAGKLRELYP